MRTKVLFLVTVVTLCAATSAFAISEAELQTVAGRMSNAAGRTFNVSVVPSIDDGDYNAASYGKGKIEVTNSFLDDLASPDEAAYVLGHEMTHDADKHGPKQTRVNIIGAILGIIGARALGARDSDGIQTGAVIGASVVGGHTSRVHENDADVCGVDLAFKAGYDPWAAVPVAERLQRKFGNGTARVPLLGLAATHPDTGARIARIKAECQKLSAGQPVSAANQTATHGAQSGNGPTAIVVVDPGRTDSNSFGFGRGYYYSDDLSEVAKAEAETALEKMGFQIVVSTHDVEPLQDELSLENSEWGANGEGRQPIGQFSGTDNVFYVSAWISGASEKQIGDWRRELEVSGLKVGVLLRQIDLRTRRQLKSGAGIGSVNKISRVRVPLGRDDWNPIEVNLNSEDDLAREAVNKAVRTAAGKFGSASTLVASTPSPTVSEPVEPTWQPVEPPTTPPAPSDDFISPEKASYGTLIITTSDPVKVRILCDGKEVAVKEVSGSYIFTDVPTGSIVVQVATDGNNWTIDTKMPAELRAGETLELRLKRR